MEKDVVFKMHLVTKELMEVFTEDSDNDTTFYGFSEEEQGDNKSQSEDEDHGPSTAPARPFRLRVALRSRSKDPGPSQTSDEDIGPSKTTQVQDTGPSKTRQVRQKRVNFAEVSKPVAQKEEEEDEEESFLAKREQNIKANKAMLAQLMADLQKIPGGAGFLKRAEKPEKRKSSHPPRSGGDLRKNPERASRRRTRSMGGVEGTKEEPEEELELSLEEELLQVKRAPRRRAAPRPSQTTPHVIRSVDDITAEELEQVADGMTEKVYNKVTGSTCHQCRQKTIDTKTCCRSEGCRGIQGQFCGPCLKNRYGEDVKSALLDPLWQCPPCRRICNCSFCRQREGRCPTGILLPLAQYHGFSDVHSYLTSLRNKFEDEES